MSLVGIFKTASKSIAAVAGIPVTYRRGANAIPLTATPAAVKYDVVDGEGNLLENVRGWDWKIAAADLLLAGQPIEPQRGDYIERSVNGVTISHEVNYPTGSGKDQPWTFEDTSATYYVIHTKIVKTA